MRSTILRLAHLAGGWCYGTSAAFVTSSNSCYRTRPHLQGLIRSTSNHEACDNMIDEMIPSISSLRRRSMVMGPIVASLGVVLTTDVNGKAYADGNLSSIVDQLKEASVMMNGIPDLIKAENWDGGKYFSQKIFAASGNIIMSSTNSRWFIITIFNL